MSFPALSLAVQAAYALPPLEDEEFGLSWSDLDWSPDFVLTWALYRSEGAGLILGVKESRAASIAESWDGPLKPEHHR